MYHKAQIRAYRVDDEGVLFALAKSVFGARQAWRDRRTIDVLETDTVFVAEVEGSLAGYVALERAEAGVRIEQLFVSPEHDDENVGPQLLEYAEGYAISLRASALQAVVERDNRTALDFYRGRGFVRVDDDLLELTLPRQ